MSINIDHNAHIDMDVTCMHTHALAHTQLYIDSYVPLFIQQKSTETKKRKAK